MKHLAYICDDNYAMPTIVSIVSLKKNISDRCTVHVITSCISKPNKEKILSLRDDTVTIELHDVSINDYQDRLDKINQYTHVTPSALMKFELANILHDIKTVLYLDSDVIIKAPIDDIFDYDINEVYAACIPELWKILRVGNPKSNTYFNSGVMLFNLEKIRQKKIVNKLWEEKINLSYNKKITTMDQDALNNIFFGMVKFIDISYNFNPYFASSDSLEIVNSFSKNKKYQSVEELKEDVKIIQYVGKEDKPWIYSSARMGEYWDYYYLLAGYCLEDLNRVILKKGLKYRMIIFNRYLNKHGIFKTLLRIIKRQ